MADYRLKIKIGDHEFDAEGPTDVVQAQFELFKELVLSAPAKLPTPTPTETPQDSIVPPLPQNGSSEVTTDLNLNRIMSAKGRVVSLTVNVDKIHDAMLLVLLGQRTFRSKELVTGGEILDGLRETGSPLDRGDRILRALCAEGYVITVGTGRARKYRLTNSGVARGEQIARELISRVP